MPKNVVFVMDSKGVVELMQSAEMQAILTSAANSVVAQAENMSGGLEFEAKTGISGDRAAATVRTASPHAYYSTMKHNTLEKAVRGVKV